jgi:hypothetical protein
VSGSRSRRFASPARRFAFPVPVLRSRVPVLGPSGPVTRGPVPRFPASAKGSRGGGQATIFAGEMVFGQRSHDSFPGAGSTGALDASTGEREASTSGEEEDTGTHDPHLRASRSTTGERSDLIATLDKSS